MLKNFPIFLIVFSGLLSVKWEVVHNEIETALEVLCSSKLNFQFLEMNFQNERTVSNHNLIQISEAFSSPAGVRSRYSARPPGVRPMTIHPRVSRVRRLWLILLLSPARALTSSRCPIDILPWVR